ncbi:MAG: STAS domain-containing protein [Synergistaceae bacterium]|nr:STAS domain-containing protein [Synergistaceae bacterium]
MIINKTQENGNVTFTVDGRLDTITAPKLQDVLIPSIGEAKQIELDFKNLFYMSSAGLRVLLMGQKIATAKGVSFSICGVSDEVMEVFEITGFAEILNFNL